VEEIRGDVKCSGRSFNLDPLRDLLAILDRLDPPPAPERIVVSDRATLAYWWAACPVPAPIGESPKTVDVPAGLRAAFKVMLQENLERTAIGGARTGLYRELTGEEWPG